MRTRPYDFLDMSAKPYHKIYGVQVRHPKHGWCVMGNRMGTCENGAPIMEPVTFSDIYDRERYRAHLRKCLWRDDEIYGLLDSELFVRTGSKERIEPCTK